MNFRRFDLAENCSKNTNDRSKRSNHAERFPHITRINLSEFRQNKYSSRKNPNRDCKIKNGLRGLFKALSLKVFSNVNEHTFYTIANSAKHAAKFRKRRGKLIKHFRKSICNKESTPDKDNTQNGTKVDPLYYFNALCSETL